MDRLVRGVAGGGLRMRPGCALEEVAGLARGMTVKRPVTTTPRPVTSRSAAPRAASTERIGATRATRGAYGLLVRCLRAVRPYVESFRITGEDLGLGQDVVAWAVAEAGLVSSSQAVFPLLADEAAARRRLADAFAVEADGIGLGELAGGCGVAESVLTALDRAGVPYAGTRVAVRGLGAMGGATARFLTRAGLTVVAVADVKGTVANPAGLDVDALLAARDAHGTVDRAALRPGDRELSGDAWLSADAEVLVRAAVPYAVDLTNQDLVTARWIVAAADMPVVAGAEASLTACGVTVLPDPTWW
ncbi:Glu/Leu/Phe/Val dehydrogenase dimerization domain-containing protein [Streptomyces cinereospinus]